MRKIAIISLSIAGLLSISTLSWAHPPSHHNRNNIQVSGTIHLPGPVDISINQHNRHRYHKVWIPGHWERRHENLVHFPGYWEYVPKEKYRHNYYGKRHGHGRGEHYACAREYHHY